jgi:hypothetical protein
MEENIALGQLDDRDDDAGEDEDADERLRPDPERRHVAKLASDR